MKDRKNSNKMSDYVARDDIMGLLSDDEIAKVSTAETATALCEGDEYIDLEHIHLGVRSALGTPAKLGNFLPRKAVRSDTWSKILVQLASRS
jgi:hypothetical protein